MIFEMPMWLHLLTLRIITIFFLFLANAAVAGGISSSGGENIPPTEGSAWFLGDRPVRYCFEAAPDFGPSVKEISEVLEESFTIWRSYILDKKINVSDLGDARLDPYHTPRWAVGRAQILLNTQSMDRCDGSEDLKFYLGATSSEVDAYRSKFTEPTAFAQRTRFDELAGWGKGFVWVQHPSKLRGGPSNWTKPARLKGILLHEIGHVLGNSHLGGTIMEEDMGALVADGSELTLDKAEGWFGHIDNRHELYLCQSCSYSYESNDDELENTFLFQRLVGRDPVGKVFARVASQRIDPLTEKLVITVNDSREVAKFEINDEGATIGMQFGDTEVFKKAMADRWFDGKPSALGWALSSNSVSYLKSVVSRTGEHILLALNRNMGTSPLSLNILSGPVGERVYLFNARTF